MLGAGSLQNQDLHLVTENLEHIEREELRSFGLLYMALSYGNSSQKF